MQMVNIKCRWLFRCRILQRRARGLSKSNSATSRTGMGPCNKNHYSQSGVCTEACRYNDYRRTSSVTSLLQELGWEDLKSRREQNKVEMMYRIVNNLVEIRADQYLTATGISSRGHHQRFLVPYCSINAYMGSFFPSAVRF